MTENLIIVTPSQWEDVEIGQLVEVRINEEEAPIICLMIGGRMVISLDCPSNYWLYPNYPKLLHIYPRGTKITYIS